MAYCQNCGAKLEDNAKFCGECGIKIESMEHPEQGNDSIEKDRIESSTEKNAPIEVFNSSVNKTNKGITLCMSRENSDGDGEPKKRKSKILIIVVSVVCLILVLTFVFIFAAAKRTHLDESYCGVYTASYGVYEGSRMNIGSLWENGFTIELMQNGKCNVSVDGQTETAPFRLKNEGKIQIKLKGYNLEGSLSDGVLTLKNVMDTDMDIILVLDSLASENADSSVFSDTEIETTPKPILEETEKAENVEYSWWNGNWYGWWVVYEAGGEYAYLEDCCFDTCAVIQVYDDDTGLIDIWDSDCEKGSNISYVSVNFEPGITDKGRMVSDSGYFYESDINSGDWVIDPDNSAVSSFDQMICIEGTMVDPDNSDNWIDYMVFLRPWGMSWEDVRNGNTADMPYSDMMPPGYDSWYTSRMNDEMPEYFGADNAA